MKLTDSIKTPACLTDKEGEILKTNPAFDLLRKKLKGIPTFSGLSDLIGNSPAPGVYPVIIPLGTDDKSIMHLSMHVMESDEDQFFVSVMESSEVSGKSDKMKATVVLDSSLNLKKIDPLACEYLGWDMDNITLKKIQAALNPEQNLEKNEFGFIDSDYIIRKNGRLIKAKAYKQKNEVRIDLRDISSIPTLYDELEDCNKRYKSVFQHAQVGMYQTMVDGTILGVNPAFAAIFGYKSANEFINTVQNVNDLYLRPEDRELLQSALIADGSIRNYECVLKKKDGSPINVSLTSVCIYSDDGDVSHFEGTVFDLTERDSYKQMMKVFQDTIREVYDSIIITDLNDKIIFINEAFTRMYGYEPSEVIGKKSSTFWKSHNADSNFKEINKLTKTKGAFHGEVVNVKKDGTEFPVLLSTSLIKDDKGEAYATMGIARDITAEKAAETELKEARDKAEQANKLKSNLMANMSHEVRTPLTGIIGFASILMEQLEGNDDLLFYVENVKSSGERLLETMNNILMVSEIESNKVILKPGHTLLWEIVQKSINYNKALASKTGLTIESEGDRELTVFTDALLLSQVLNIILNNALKFTEEGGVMIRVLQEENCGIVEIQDTGVGISEDFLDQMYEAFAQESAGIRRKFQGVGLGLNICKKYIEMIRGNIYVESKKNIGTTFRISLPVDPF